MSPIEHMKEIAFAMPTLTCMATVWEVNPALLKALGCGNSSGVEYSV
jgi:hypothetical protein